MNHPIISIIFWLLFFLKQARASVTIYFTTCSSLTSIMSFVVAIFRIRAIVKMCSNCWLISEGTLRFYDTTIRIEIKKRRILIRGSFLKSKNWSGIVCHFEFKHCTYLFLSLFLSFRYLFELDFDRILNFKGILEKIFIYLYKLKIV